MLASAEYGVVVLGSLLWSRLVLGCSGMAGLFCGVLFVWVMLMVIRLTLPRVRLTDGVLAVCYTVLVPGMLLAIVLVL